MTFGRALKRFEDGGLGAKIFLLFILLWACGAEAQVVLEFPEIGFDEPSAYEGYRTRFFRDTEKNTLQVYIQGKTGRIVQLWANSANESVGFTARTTDGRPAVIVWGSERVRSRSQRNSRRVEYDLISRSSEVEIGLFLLGSMRIERDFQYLRRDSLSFTADPFPIRELQDLVANLERIPIDEQQGHLMALNAADLEELRSRLRPKISFDESGSIGRIEQISFDAKNRLALELRVDGRKTNMSKLGRSLILRSLSGEPFPITIAVETDAKPLAHLKREEIFNDEFLAFYESKRKSGERKEFRWLERQVKEVELVCFQEKLMAGLPNFATYFGRDMLMSALMMDPVWSPSMLEHVISRVLGKLSESGEVSHEEAVGGQAIRENAARYNDAMAEYVRQAEKQDRASANSALADARAILADLQSVRENYNMVDDDFQLPVLVARYLSKPEVPAERKREFLDGAMPGAHGASRLELILLNLDYVSRATSQYVTQPKAVHLVSFRNPGDHRWQSGSWRDSGPGYGGGRFAMDVNAIWAPKALESLRVILAVFDEVGITADTLETITSQVRGTILGQYCRNPQSLERAISAWKGARRHFEVTLTPQQIQQKLQSKLRWLPLKERSFWEGALARNDGAKRNLKFLALSLDEDGNPIPVVNTDPATLLFLEDLTDRILDGSVEEDRVLGLVRPFLLQYPVGLFVEGLGPLVANDAYASKSVRENFAKDPYHSPRTVWGREVNLLLLGLAKQLSACYDATGRLRNAGLKSYAAELRRAFDDVARAVTASGLKHNELWSYRVENGMLFPVRYGSSSDVQLWNVTDLAVQYLTSRIPSP